ncbi:MAG: SRPBCC family protein [Burkholderiales bacterium]|nr:SRPBCC family protein [Burkholderiales bacterium]
MLYAVLAVVLVVAIVLALALRKPATFRVERRVVIDAPAAAAHARVEDFRRWAEWSPWEKLDPAMRRTHSGAAAGVGAVYEWSGTGKVGAGRMEIRESTPARIVIQLDFIKPFEGHNIAEFDFAPEGARTAVRWAMHGPAPFISRLMQVFMNMDAMIGRDFEAGLANLKAAAEAAPAT